MANIPELTPIASRALRPTSEPGAFKLVAEVNEQMYEASWNELFNLKKQLGNETSAANGYGIGQCDQCPALMAHQQFHKVNPVFCSP